MTTEHNSTVQCSAEAGAGTLPRLLTVPQVAEILGLSLSQTYTLVKRGEIRSVRIGRSVRLIPSHVEEFIEANVSYGGAQWGA
jgi:excisionase family DNA binding protein